MEKGTSEPGSPSRSSWKREVPPPWIDCPSCGWRHYPDIGQRRGPQLPETCTSCGTTLTRRPRS